MSVEEKSFDKWLKAAYQLFADVGLEVINIKTLSVTCELPCSNFYDLFADMEDLIERLLHDQMGKEGQFDLAFRHYLPQSELVDGTLSSPLTVLFIE